MIAAWQTVANGLGGAILENEAVIIAKHRVADGGFDTHARGPSGKNQAGDAAAFKNGVEVGLVESAISVLVEHEIVGIRPEFVDDIGIPGIANQDAARGPLRRGRYFART